MADRTPRPGVHRWTVVLPVKGGSEAKSRLGATSAATWLAPADRVGPPARTALALAIALDCLEAVLAAGSVGRVLVVTGDQEVASTAARLGAEVVAQPDAPGLTAAVAAGLAAAGPGPTAVLLADLPALRATDLDRALAAVVRACPQPGAWGCVPDADGTGTVAIAALESSSLVPAFGAGSAAAHAAAGATVLELDLPRLRRDVDVPEDLDAAVALGLGRRTRRTLTHVQATVLSWDASAETGAVVTDEGLRMPLAPDALRGSGLRHLRPGQRVTCSAGEDGTVAEVRIRGIEG